MAGKFRLTLRNQVWRSAFKALLFGLALFFFYLNPSLWRALLFVIISGWLYSRPLFNSLAYLPLFSALLILSFWLWPSPPYQLPLVFLLSFSFWALLGLKNLYLTYRQYWSYFISLLLSYLTFLNFFLAAKTFFFWHWLLLLIVVALILKNIFDDKLVTALGALIIGQLLWAVAWLPIGFLASANLLFLTTLLLLDSFYQERLLSRDLALFALLAVLILGTSYWVI